MIFNLLLPNKIEASATEKPSFKLFRILILNIAEASTYGWKREYLQKETSRSAQKIDIPEAGSRFLMYNIHGLPRWQSW